MLLCRRHHRLVHEEGCRVCLDAHGQVLFFGPTGRAIGATPRPTTLGETPLEDLIEANRLRGVEPEWNTGMPRHHRDAEIPWKIEADATHRLAAAGALRSTGPRRCAPGRCVRPRRM